MQGELSLRSLFSVPAQEVKKRADTAPVSGPEAVNAPSPCCLACLHNSTTHHFNTLSSAIRLCQCLLYMLSDMLTGRHWTSMSMPCAQVGKRRLAKSALELWIRTQGATEGVPCNGAFRTPDEHAAVLRATLHDRRTPKVLPLCQCTSLTSMPYSRKDATVCTRIRGPLSFKGFCSDIVPWLQVATGAASYTGGVARAGADVRQSYDEVRAGHTRLLHACTWGAVSHAERSTEACRQCTHKIVLSAALLPLRQALGGQGFAYALPLPADLGETRDEDGQPSAGCVGGTSQVVWAAPGADPALFDRLQQQASTTLKAAKLG